jgi:hypothetical protein
MAKKKLRFKKDSLPSGCNPDGSEICDSKPTELRAKMVAPVTMRQKMQSLWKEFNLKQKEAMEFETIEDAADFDVDNDVMPASGYETEGEFVHVYDALPDDIKELGEANMEPEAESKAQSAEADKGEDNG